MKLTAGSEPTRYVGTQLVAMSLVGLLLHLVGSSECCYVAMSLVQDVASSGCRHFATSLHLGRYVAI